MSAPRVDREVALPVTVTFRESDAALLALLIGRDLDAGPREAHLSRGEDSVERTIGWGAHEIRAALERARLDIISAALSHGLLHSPGA